MVAPVDRPTIAPGAAALEVEMVFHESTVTSAAASSPMKLLTPISRGQSVWAFTSSFGGGLVAGDRTQLSVKVGGGARCFFGTQSSTKVYRNPSALPCDHETRAELMDDSLLVFAPEPVQAFAKSHYSQKQEFHLAPQASLILLDWFSAGRTARGERWAFTQLESRNDIYLGGERALVDSILLAAEDLAQRMGRFNCLATLILIGPAVRLAAESLMLQIAGRPVEKRAALVCSASPVNGGALLRVAGEEVEAVRRELGGHLSFLRDLLGDDPLARKW